LSCRSITAECYVHCFLCSVCGARMARHEPNACIESLDDSDLCYDWSTLPVPQTNARPTVCSLHIYKPSHDHTVVDCVLEALYAGGAGAKNLVGARCQVGISKLRLHLGSASSLVQLSNMNTIRSPACQQSASGRVVSFVRAPKAQPCTSRYACNNASHSSRIPFLLVHHLGDNRLDATPF
jgi:hypothetical protein